MSLRAHGSWDISHPDFRPLALTVTDAVPLFDPTDKKYENAHYLPGVNPVTESLTYG